MDEELERLRSRVRELEGRESALDLELERAHHLLDQWGLPRELGEGPDGRPLELSLVGRLELLEDEPE